MDFVVRLGGREEDSTGTFRASATSHLFPSLSCTTSVCLCPSPLMSRYISMQRQGCWPCTASMVFHSSRSSASTSVSLRTTLNHLFCLCFPVLSKLSGRGILEETILRAALVKKFCITWFTFWLFFCSDSEMWWPRVTMSPSVSSTLRSPYVRVSEYGEERSDRGSRWLLVLVGFVCRLLAAEAALGEGRGCGCGCGCMVGEAAWRGKGRECTDQKYKLL